MIKLLNMIDINPIYQYYMNKTLQDETFVLLSTSDFIEMAEKGFVLYDQDNNQIRGFIIGHIRESQCFITLLIGDSLDIKNNLLISLESIIQKNSQINELLIHFMNPVSLAWYPRKHIVHPCYQGVALDEENYNLYLNHHFVVHSTQDTYYRELSTFELPENVIKQLNHHISEGIEISFYDAKIHQGLIEFTDDIHAPHWKNIIMRNDMDPHALPLLVALKDKKVIGFTGPLKVEPNGRGYFAGIGVLEKERGHKIGKTLFFMLCQSLKEMGASYMTLYTGNNNTARFIYLQAGFEVVKSFATMKKIIK